MNHRFFRCGLLPLGCLVFLLVSLFSTSAFAIGDLLHTFDDPIVSYKAQFGHSVAVEGNHILIGAYNHDTNGQGVGQAHLYDATTGDLLHTFNDPTVTNFDQFGYSVAVDGNLVLIGARLDRTKGSSGQAHLFDATTGNLLHTFNDPTVTNTDQFGHSVAVDGNLVLIGARLDRTKGDRPGTSIGQAHLFDATSGNLLHTFNDPTVTDQDAFGHSVALDGNLVLIGAVGDDTNRRDVGQAHLFDATSGNLLHTFNDPTVTRADAFGYSVAVDGNLVLIGARLDDTYGLNIGQAHLFDATSGNLLHTFNDPTVTDQEAFGHSVALDGNLVLIGAIQDSTKGNRIGQAHLFDATSGNLLHTFNDPTVTDQDWFGVSVALDGNHVLIGASGDSTNGNRLGQAHLFDIRVPEPGTGVLLVGMALVASGCRRRLSITSSSAGQLV